MRKYIEIGTACLALWLLIVLVHALVALAPFTITAIVAIVFLRAITR